jgi:hypothetical protein
VLHDDRLAALMVRIGALERDATALADASGTDDSRCRADLLRASLVGTRASLDLASDDSAITSAEGVVDTVSRNLTGLTRPPQ